MERRRPPPLPREPHDYTSLHPDDWKRIGAVTRVILIGIAKQAVLIALLPVGIALGAAMTGDPPTELSIGAGLGVWFCCALDDLWESGKRAVAAWRQP